MSDPYAKNVAGLESPAENGAAVAPSDSTDLPVAGRALWVGGSGNLNVTTVGGSTFVITGVPSGTLLPIRVTRVWSTSTTATSISVWY